jgi:uncharacterized membrane protein
MILYNTLMGFCAGLILLETATMVARADGGRDTVLADDRDIVLAGKRNGLRLLVLGAPLTVLSLVMVLTWPLTVNPPINIAFGEPSLMLGVLAIAGGVVVCVRGDVTIGYARTFTPVIAALGLMLLAITASILRFDLVGDAPAIEPISSRVTGWENTTFALVYLLSALGCLATLGIRHRAARLVTVWGWRLAGVFFLGFSVLNYYTHIGLLTCSGTGRCLPF